MYTMCNVGEPGERTYHVMTLELGSRIFRGDYGMPNIPFTASPSESEKWRPFCRRVRPLLRPEQVQVRRLHACAIGVRRERAWSCALWRCFARAMNPCLTLCVARARRQERAALWRWACAGCSRRRWRSSQITIGGRSSTLAAPETWSRSCVLVQCSVRVVSFK